MEDLRHSVLNGILAIKGAIRQYEVGMFSADEMKNKVEDRCRQIEKEILRIKK